MVIKNMYSSFFAFGLGNDSGGLFDDTDGDGLFHISDGESSQRGVLAEDFNTHGLGGNHVDHAGLSGLDEFGEFFNDLTGSSIDGAQDFLEFDGDVGGVAIQDGAVSVLDLTGVVHDDDLGLEVLALSGGVVLGVGADVSSLDVLDGHGFDVESDVVTGSGLGDGLVMHLNGLDVGGDVSGGEGDVHVGLQDTSLDSSDGDRADTTDLVNILEGESQWLVGGSFGGDDGVQSLDQSGSFVPGEVG